MKFLLDTNICIYVIKQKPAAVLQRFDTHALGDLGVSTISVAELIYGVQKSAAPSKNQSALERFLAPLEFLDFDLDAASVYGTIRADLQRAGQPIGHLDTLLAAQAVSRDLTLVTHDVREFGRVKGLKVENWVSPDPP